MDIPRVGVNFLTKTPKTTTHKPSSKNLTSLKPGKPRAASQPQNPTPTLNTKITPIYYVQPNRSKTKTKKTKRGRHPAAETAGKRASGARLTPLRSARSTATSLQACKSRLQLNPKTGQKVNRLSTNPRQTKQSKAKEGVLT
jgi:hypothetical protein